MWCFFPMGRPTHPWSEQNNALNKTLISSDTYFDSSMNVCVCDILDAKYLILKLINQTTLDIFLIHHSEILNVMCTHSLFLPWFPRKRSHRSGHRKRERDGKKKGKRQKHSSLTGSSQGGVNPWRGKRERMSAHYSAWHSRPQKIALFIFLVKLWLC